MTTTNNLETTPTVERTVGGVSSRANAEGFGGVYGQTVLVVFEGFRVCACCCIITSWMFVTKQQVNNVTLWMFVAKRHHNSITDLARDLFSFAFFWPTPGLFSE